MICRKKTYSSNGVLFHCRASITADGCRLLQHCLESKTESQSIIPVKQENEILYLFKRLELKE